MAVHKSIHLSSGISAVKRSTSRIPWPRRMSVSMVMVRVSIGWPAVGEDVTPIHPNAASAIATNEADRTRYGTLLHLPPVLQRFA